MQRKEPSERRPDPAVEGGERPNEDKDKRPEAETVESKDVDEVWSQRELGEQRQDLGEAVPADTADQTTAVGGRSVLHVVLSSPAAAVRPGMCCVIGLVTGRPA